MKLITSIVFVALALLSILSSTAAAPRPPVPAGPLINELVSRQSNSGGFVSGSDVSNSLCAGGSVNSSGQCICSARCVQVTRACTEPNGHCTPTLQSSDASSRNSAELFGLAVACAAVVGML
ncbi:uncharacterized protein LY89DRAFT_669824 [Mollisia scopiformis]|uniref:Uncharacterized protein n=1 Tax=Mollisia scopiformis TaxID=149040 RepID=A0A194X802_MOLSC|nr:uncharacterized protein LY89DRAFT_669824 [Mollisia scopiformis]KUJ16295.1 hypothetical protein LY89DRAFT_669824 [Mollisia scopiformis]